MDRGPFRAQKTADGRPAGRPESVQRHPEESQTVREDSSHRQKTVGPHTLSKEKSPKRFIAPLIMSVVVIIIVGVAGWFAWSSSQAGIKAIDTSKFQAVFFTNGQVYFGKLQHLNGEYLKLTDVYYLQTQENKDANSENPQQATTDQRNVQLVKLGDEIHGPEDEMVISKDQMLFYENLKPDGKVTKSIQAYKSQ